jgi:hypothetical protein
MSDRTGLEIADVVARVVHQLHMPDAALMSVLQPFEFQLQEVEPLHIGDDRRLSRFVRGFEIGSA